jgi:hypothetical protein
VTVPYIQAVGEKSPSSVSPRLRLIWVVAAIVLIAGAAGGWVLFNHPTVHSQPSTPLTTDGPTLYEALAALNHSVSATGDGPWTLFSAIGLAPTAQYAPGAIGFFPNESASLRACAPAFNGLTVWNGTEFPRFDGDIGSGTAPFWQFGWRSNASDQLLIATDVNGTTTAYPPISLTSPCAQASAMAYGSAEYVPWMNPLPINTPLQALNASKAVGYAYASKNPGFAEMFNLGWTPFSATNHGGNGAGLAVEFSRCGIVGAAGWQPESVAGELSTGQVANTFNGTLSCTAIRTQFSYQPYQIAFNSSGSAVAVGPVSSGLSLPFQVEFPDWSSNGSAFADAWGLVSWMAGFSLSGQLGTELPSAPPSCLGWVSSLADCAANASGWGLVLLSAGGAWLDAFPSLAGGSTWAIPNVLFATGQTLVLLTPVAWTVPGDALSASATALVPTLIGSTVLA